MVLPNMTVFSPYGLSNVLLKSTWQPHVLATTMSPSDFTNTTEVFFLATKSSGSGGGGVGDGGGGSNGVHGAGEGGGGGGNATVNLRVVNLNSVSVTVNVSFDGSNDGREGRGDGGALQCGDKNVMVPSNVRVRTMAAESTAAVNTPKRPDFVSIKDTDGAAAAAAAGSSVVLLQKGGSYVLTVLKYSITVLSFSC